MRAVDLITIILGLLTSYYWYRCLFKRDEDIGDLIAALMLTVACTSWLAGTLYFS